jgi:predicted alpha-1,6-mannanase (GH76 family)
MVEGPVGATGGGVGDTVPDTNVTGRVADVDWAARAGAAERAVVRRHLRRLGGIVPGTRIGRIRWPRLPPVKPWPWHYWWQAHLLDCLVDAQLGSPRPGRADTIAALGNPHGPAAQPRSWTNDYYDDVAWFGLAVQRAGTLARRSARPALGAINPAAARRVERGLRRRGLVAARGRLKNAPANGPAAILLARGGHVGLAASIADWMHDTLLDPETGLIRDGVRVGPDGAVRAVEGTVYTYCQGVYLGACVALADVDGDARWSARAAALMDAIGTHLVDPDGVVPGYDDGGDGGLFNGILARYLADAALRRPELAPAAARIVLASAAAVWEGRLELGGGPVFAQDWRRPARSPRPGCAEADLSVQLSWRGCCWRPRRRCSAPVDRRRCSVGVGAAVRARSVVRCALAESIFGVRGAFVDRAAHLLPEPVETHGAAEHEPRHREHRRDGPEPRRGVEQARTVEAEQDQRRHPAGRADGVRRDVAAVVHPRRAGDHWRERADPRDPSRDDDRPEAPALEEGRGPGQVRPVEHPALLAGEHAGAGVAADEVAHLVPGHRDGRGDAAEHPGPRLVPLLGQQHPRGDQQRVAGRKAR